MLPPTLHVSPLFPWQRGFLGADILDARFLCATEVPINALEGLMAARVGALACLFPRPRH